MTIYNVTYSSMTAHYSGFVEADDERQAKRRFGDGAFSHAEMRMMTVRKATLSEARA